MSQRRIRQTSDEVMAAREAMEASLPQNVTPMSAMNDTEAAEITGRAAFKALESAIDDAFGVDELPSEEALVEAAAEELPDNYEPVVMVPYQGACYYCGKQQFVEYVEGANPTEEEVNTEATNRCDCPEAKLDQHGSTVGAKIDMLFGAGSKQYGFIDEHDAEETSLIKQVAYHVVSGMFKGVVITLENGDKATIITVKDTTKVRRNRAAKAELEA